MILHHAELIDEFTAAGVWSREHTLLDDMEHAARTVPDRVAYSDPPNRRELIGSDPTSLTWSTLSAAADGLATALIDLGLQRDDVVVVQSPNVVELPLLYLAVSRAGGVISPVPMQWRSKDISYVADLTGSRFLIAPETFKTHRPLDDARRWQQGSSIEHLIDLARVMALAATAPRCDVLDERRPGPNDVFTLCWTSGTESQPKGCPLTHNNWNFGGQALVKSLSLRAGSHRQVAAAPVTNMLGVCLTITVNLKLAGSVALHHPLDVDLLIAQINEQRTQFLILPPAILRQLLNTRGDSLDLSSVDSIMTGGSPPSASLIAGYKDRWGVEIVNGWGMNEGAGLWAGPADVPDAALRSTHLPWYGLPGYAWPSGITGMHYKVVDENGLETTRPGDVGELRVRAPLTFPGYFNRPDLTPFDDEGYLRTGDLFLIKDDGFLSYYDRKKDIIIRGGFNVSAAEVENLVISAPGVLDCAAVGVPDEELGERVCVVVVPRDQDDPPGLTDIVAHLKQLGLAVYKLPEIIEYRSELPRNPVGKLLKREIRASVGAAARTRP
ncbi:(2,3-dihydroxybenzoyl)adenylate synthase [Aeromicrobium phragmitis]|uniref:(2,3-dihydroxybenzoyl)adenylate synthase n=1 Tax=Aeromicrobium phragmitis TaxID=2478914 RepID=A0A3L8PJA1_9ACTN|nr:class I adenylate-forming enzyme family protein [Aeromicrobium phragmitis]RLV55341.1 (2,3-dihydroxybenzoyl)adenylate synthase [Aeromicrobium phragmitis]